MHASKYNANTQVSQILLYFFPKKVVLCVLSHVRLFETPRTAAHQAPLSMGYSRQEDWSGLPFPPPKKGGINLFFLKLLVNLTAKLTISNWHLPSTTIRSCCCNCRFSILAERSSGWRADTRCSVLGVGAGKQILR